MINYIKMKQAEWKIKSMFYQTIVSALDKQNGVLKLLQNLYLSLKDTPADELQKEFVSKLADLIHEESQNDDPRQI